MGAFFSNCQVRSDSQDAVADALKPLLKEPAYVSLSVNGWVGVYPEGGSTNPEELAKQLSVSLSCAVFFWNVYDSDVFTYSLYRSGVVQDEFNSAPDYFEGQRAEGDETEDEPIDPVRVQGSPEVLLPLCVPGTTLAAIQGVLHPKSASNAAKRLITFSPLSDDQYLFADHQASDLAKLLGMDNALAPLSYRYIEAGEIGIYVLADFRLTTAGATKANTGKSPKETAAVRKGGKSPKQRDDAGVSTLVTAARMCRPDLVRDLLESGYDVNLAVDAASLRSQQKRNPTIADVLASYMSQRYGNIYETGFTALMAVSGAFLDDTARQFETVQLLLAAGADVNAHSETGRTALGEAMKNNSEVAEMLRTAGALE